MKIKVILRFGMKKVECGYISVCLELSLVSFGDTPQECKRQMNEAITAYIEVARENTDKKIVMRKVPFYWFKKLAFDYSNNDNHDNKYKVERMILVGV